MEYNSYLLNISITTAPCKPLKHVETSKALYTFISFYTNNRLFSGKDNFGEHTDLTYLFSLAEKQQKEVWSSRLQKWVYERFGVYIEDFRFQPEESTVEAEEPLSAKRWV